MEHAFTNDLIHENSPYLLQHAHNPVQWHAWGETAIAKAKKTDKPILVSIGYAACHWCHVMERESFENEEVAAYMNEHFINIKIDREERPDLDHIYMDAVQAITGSGGWPLNVFLTTETKPFYGGTYFPPQKAFNRASWKDVLLYINDAWQNRRDEIEQQAQTLLDHIKSSEQFISKSSLPPLLASDKKIVAEQCKLMAEIILKSADNLYGGFGAAPKFPQTFTIQYLLAYGHFFKDAKSLSHAEFSLQQMLKGGIYDHLAGGLARYSTDAAWLAPHFEKMLYDNALLVSVLCDAWQITKNDIYKTGIEKTLDFFLQEMRSGEGGFFAAIDADSDGVEGKFYVWDKVEVEAILGEDASIFCKWYDISEKGNWEGKNILRILKEKEIFAEENNISISSLEALITSGNEKLLAKRNQRSRPLTDDKILLGWNALLLTALCNASAALSNENYKLTAISLFNFIKEKFSEEGKIIYHTYKNGLAKHPAYLDDYAYLIHACILLQEITSDQQYLIEARTMTYHVIDNFMNEETGYFYYTHRNQADIVARKTEVFDNAIPSGNSMMTWNLFYLSVAFDNPAWFEIAWRMMLAIEPMVSKYPGSFGVWANILLKQFLGINEIAICGKGFEKLRNEMLSIYLPNKILQCSVNEENFPLLRHKEYTDETIIYLCKNYECFNPVDSVNELKSLLKMTGI